MGPVINTLVVLGLLSVAGIICGVDWVKNDMRIIEQIMLKKERSEP